MNLRTVSLALAAGYAAFTLASCSGKPSGDNSASGPATPSASGPTVAAVSLYDGGPRASETPVNQSLVEQGEGLFKTKGCSACHAFGQKLTGPDLAGVTHRRTAEWIEHQILHPEVMAKTDPISHGLFATFALQMPNQGLTPEEAKAVIEHFKHKDHELNEK